MHDVAHASCVGTPAQHLITAGQDLDIVEIVIRPTFQVLRLQSFVREPWMILLTRTDKPSPKTL